MGFNVVYKALQDVFPQIDSRLLRAVAIEHSKDADLAVEVVLVEIIPNLSAHSQSQSSTSSFSSKIENLPSHSEVVVDGGKILPLESISTDIVGNGPPKSGESSIFRFSSVDKRGYHNNHRGEGLFGKITSRVVENDIPVTTGYITKQPTSQYASTPKPVIQESHPGSSPKTKPELLSPITQKPNCGEGLFGQIASCLIEKDSGFLTKQPTLQSVSTPEPSSPVTQEHESGSCSKTKSESNSGNRVEGLFSPIAARLVENDLNVKKQPTVTVPDLNTPATQEQDDGSFSKSTPESSPAASVNEKVVNDSQEKGLFGQIAACLVSNQKDSSAVTQEQDPGTPSKTTLESENNAVVIEENTEDESTSKLTKSDQVCNIELLEDIIEEARNEKKTLVSTMDAVVELMREVEDKEKAAEEAKEEATRDCSHIFAKVDELKQALGRAKEANDMHSGEVYAEKAILATEMKELQVRLFTLSDERNKSLGILNEMREALEIRLAAAKKEIEAAEAHKVEKQKSAKEALAFQESQLEKVVEESKKLKREAEENSKLQEFLMDRGRAIDILQGEITVKCQDVMLLKEKLDKRMPLSLSSSQTSSILAAVSPSSSFRSHTTTATLVPEAGENGDMYETPKKSLEDSSYENSKGAWSRAESLNGEEKQSGDAWKLLLNDDDWELFDKGELAA